MDISLVICTRNRATQLERSLARLGELQTTLSWECVVVDSASTDLTHTVLEEWAASVPISVTLLTAARPGLGRAHNIGWKAARAPLVAMIDDDCYPNPDFLDAVAKCFAEDTALGFIGGRVLLYDPTDLRMTIMEETERRNFAPGSFLLPGSIQGANFAFRRATLEDIGGFDEMFGPGAHFNAEDVDAVTRASAAGWHGAYDPRPVVYHHHGRKTLEELDHLIKSYSKGAGAYYAKCLLDSRLRRVTLREWNRTLQLHGRRNIPRVLAAGAEFYVRRLMHR